MATVPQRKSYYFVVRVPAIESKGFMKDYVSTAVKKWRHGGAPDDPLYKAPDRAFTVRNTLYELERETLMNLKKDIRHLFEGNEWPTGIYQSVEGLVDKYLAQGR